MTVISEVWDKPSLWVNSRSVTVRENDKPDLMSSHLCFFFFFFFTLSQVHASLKSRSVLLAWVSLKINGSSCPSHVLRTFIKSQSESNYGSYRSQLKLFAFKRYCRVKYFQSPQRFIIALSESARRKMKSGVLGVWNPHFLFSLESIYHKLREHGNEQKSINTTAVRQTARPLRL